MTLRQMLQEIGLEPALPHLRQAHRGQPVESLVGQVYSQVVRELLELPAAPPPDDDPDPLVSIRVTPQEGSRSVLGVGASGTLYALDYTDWAELIDLPVAYDSTLSPAEALAHVLWEITFYGFSRQEVEQAARELLSRLDDIWEPRPPSETKSS